MNGVHAWLMLWRVSGIGARRFHRLLDSFLDPEAVLRATPAQLQATQLDAALCQNIVGADEASIAPDLAWLRADSKHSIITFHDPLYPQQLKTIVDPPPLLYAQGDPQLLCWPQLAIVGSRHPTTGGRYNAREFARYLASKGIGITSGMAEGIDAEAHEGALDVHGITIAVAGTGLDRVYPAQNRDLAHRITQSGLIVSEFPVGAVARAGHFPRRNRIITGLSLGVLIIEAGARSGSLISARLGGEQGREVFAIPGSIHNPMARGCHQLIRQGAKLVETASDIMEELAHLLPVSKLTSAVDTVTSNTLENLDHEQQILLEKMGYDPITLDQLTDISGLTVENISSMLLVMELHGYVHSLPGGRYCRHHSSSA